MHNINSLLIDLTLITIYATITTLICKKLKQPLILGYILAGIFAGPNFNLLPTAQDTKDIALWADIGVIFLLFGLGLEFSFKKMINVGKSALITASMVIVFMLFSGYCAGLLLGWTTMDSFFLGSMISMSSTTIIIKAFSDLNIRQQKFTDLVFGVLIVEDLVGVLLLVLLPTIALSNSINGIELGLSALKLVFFLVLCFITGIYLVPSLLNKISSILNDEMLLLFSISLCFGMVLLATYSGFSAALGAFIMGSILAETPVISKIEKNIQPLKDFFGAVFFVSVGMMVNPSMFVTYAFPIFVITLVVIIGQVTFSCLGFIASGQDLNTSIHGGLSLAQVGEFAFIIASLGLSLNVLSPKVYPIIVAVSVITTFTTPLIIRSSDTIYEYLTKFLPKKWLKSIETDSTKTKVNSSEERLWSTLFKNYALHLTLFSIILYSIILLALAVRPYIYQAIPYKILARILITSLTLICMAPFLNALIGWNILTIKYLRTNLSKILPQKENKTSDISNTPEVHQQNKIAEKGYQILDEKISQLRNFIYDRNTLAKIFYKLWQTKPSSRLPLILLTSIRLITAVLFIMATVNTFLTTNTKVTLILVLGAILLISRSRWFLDQYIKMEKQFLDNLNGALNKKVEQ